MNDPQAVTPIDGSLKGKLRTFKQESKGVYEIAFAARVPAHKKQRIVESDGRVSDGAELPEMQLCNKGMTVHGRVFLER